jgi:MATE family, multidrug efflux pump
MLQVSRKYRFHFIRTLQIAWPIMFGQLGHIMASLVDTAMVGQVGYVSLAAAALANSFFVLFLTFGMGTSYGIGPLVSAADGQKDHTAIVQWLRHGMIVNFLSGVLLFLLIIISSPLIMHLNQPADVVILALPYLKILALSIIPFMVFQHFRQFAEGLAYTKAAMYISLISNVLNVLLNYVLIFGKFGFPRMELIGAGWATLISRVIMAGLMIGYVYYNRHFKKFREGFQLRNLSKYYNITLLKLGVPIGFQYTFEAGAFVVGAFLIGTMGDIPLAAHQVAIMLAATTYLMASGISSAVTVRVGKYLGMGDLANIRRSANTGFILVFLFMGFCALLFIAFREVLPVLFSNNTEVRSIASLLLIVAAIFQLSDGVQVVALGALRGIKNVRMPTLIAIFSYWVISLPAGYFLAFKLHLNVFGIWWGFAIGLTSAAIMLTIRFYKSIKSN